VTHDQAEAMVTSDRIAVMNKGRVEQIDAPYALYGRPKTRFVAGFIGRTNFVEGKSNGDAVHFGGFSVARAALQTEGSLPQNVVVSIRPQSIHLLKQNPGGGNGRCCVQGSVLRRAYLGEYWDYQVTLPGAAQHLRVTARPQEVFQEGEPVWVEIDTAQLTVIS
jgi:iron(III) transport system ATP-binding protein